MAKIIIMADGESQREIPLTRERLTIGRSAQNDLAIDHAAVSSRHAVIVSTPNDVYLEDLGSTNGSKVNGQPVHRHYLQNGDVIALGKCEIRYTAEPDQASGESAMPVSSMAATTQAPYQKEVQDDAGSGLKGNTVAGSVAVIRVLNGVSAGKEVVLTKALTTIGRPGLQVAVISNSSRGYHITHVEGAPYPLVNGDSIGESIYLLTNNEVIDLSGTQIRFTQMII